MFSVLIDLFKYFSPRWFSKILEEAVHVPAVVAGLLFVWATIAISGAFTYVEIAKANEQMADMQSIVARNTVALDCSRRDRQIGRKQRDINNLELLIERAEDDTERRQLEAELTTRQTEIARMERAYASRCL